MNGVPLHRVLVRAVLAGTCATLLAMAVHDHLVRAMLPAFERVFTLAARDFTLHAMALATHGSDRVVRAEVGLARPVVVGERLVVPDPRGRAVAATLAGHVPLVPAVALALALAWPVAGWREAVRRAAIVLPLALLAMLADLPLVLVAEVWALFPDGARGFDPLAAWAAFLQGGGRIAVAVAIAAVAVTAARGSAFTAGAPGGTMGRTRPQPRRRRHPCRRTRRCSARSHCAQRPCFPHR